MAFWNRNNKEIAQLPAEYQQYYEAEARDRRSSAWLFSAGALVLGLLILFGLFFGIRALYRSSRDDNKNQPAAPISQSQPTSDSPEGTTPAETPSPDSTPSPSADTPAPASTPSSTATTTTPPTTTVPDTGVDE